MKMMNPMTKTAVSITQKRRIFVTRHAGAIAWLQEQGIAPCVIKSHIELGDIRAGDSVYGVLPIHWIAEISLLDAEYFHLVIPVTSDLRGKELTVAQLNQYGAYLQRYTARAAEDHDA
ncbi:MAG: CRISPR-associated protein Csx16 [Motiliproteus sp.]